jgi:hypothetical protein
MHRKRIPVLRVRNAFVLAWLVHLLAIAPLGAADINFKADGLKAPVFDLAGHLTRRLTAGSATGPVDSPRLDKGKVEFFAPESADWPTAVLDFEQALYRKTDESIRGSDTIRLVSPQGTVSGRRYECWLDTGLLKLGSEVKFSSDDVRLTGKQGEIHFDPKGTGKTDLIKEAVVTGSVMVERTGTSKLPFDRAETDLAHYSAEQQKLFLKTPVTIWKNGDKAVTEVASGFYEIDLKAEPKVSGH